MSVVITAYNDAPRVADAIASVLNQTRAAAAIIVVDDGSTDNTGEVVRQYSQARYIRQENSGVSAARNAALALVESSHVLFLDGDDVLFPETLQRGMAAMNPALGFVYGGYDEISPTGDRKPVPVKAYPDPYVELLGWNFVWHGSAIYNVEALRSLGGFPTELRACEDWDVLLSMARRHPVQPYHYIAGEYRRRDGSLSKKDPLMMMDRAHEVLSRQQDLTAQQAAAQEAGQGGVTRVYSLIAAWMFVAMLRKGRLGEARALAAGARKRSPYFTRQVASVVAEVGRRIISNEKVREHAA